MSEKLSEIFQRFARDEFHDSSPLYERLSLGVAHDKQLLALAAHCRKGERVPNLFFAAVHYLLLSGIEHPVDRFYRSRGGSFELADDPLPDFRAFCRAQTEAIRELIANRLVQTNEVSRCAGLMPLFAVAARWLQRRPLFLVDIGASAGLNLFWDRFSFEYGDRLKGGVKDSPVRIECALRGSNLPPLPTALPRVAARVGLDLNPLDVGNESDALWLRALIWPEHQKRAELLRRAIEIVRSEPPKLLAGDGVELLPDVMKSVPDDSVLCISRIFTQIPRPRSERLHALIAEYGVDRDLVMITARARGGDDSELVLTTFINGRRDERGLAFMQNHGDWIEWLNPQ